MILLKELSPDDTTITFDYDKDGDIPDEGDVIILGEEGDDEELRLGKQLYNKNGLCVFVIADRGQYYIDEEDEDD
jgi:hypothetical protein